MLVFPIVFIVSLIIFFLFLILGVRGLFNVALGLLPFSFLGLIAACLKGDNYA